MTVAIGYVRVSTAEQSGTGLGLAAQRSAIVTACASRGWQLLEILEDAGISSAARERPGLDSALRMCAAGDVLVVAKLDRLARSLTGYAQLLERAKAEGWRLCALDAPDADTPQGEAMQAMTAVFAQLERRLIGQRTRDALAAARARGVTLGRPVETSPELLERIVTMKRRRRMTARAIAAELNGEGVAGPRGGVWYTSTVAEILTRAGIKLKRGRPRGRAARKGQRPWRVPPEA